MYIIQNRKTNIDKMKSIVFLPAASSALRGHVGSFAAAPLAFFHSLVIH
jgi:hypothetical protein